MRSRQRGTRAVVSVKPIGSPKARPDKTVLPPPATMQDLTTLLLDPSGTRFQRSVRTQSARKLKNLLTQSFPKETKSSKTGGQKPPARCSRQSRGNKSG